MTPADPLAQLRGLHLPAPIGFWPPAPGWWALAGVAVVAIVATVVLLRRRRRSLGHHALREAARIAETASDVRAFVAALSELTRRVAIQRFGAERVAALHGADWERFLVETGPPARRGRRAVDPEAARLLALAPYAPPDTLHETIELNCEGFTLDRDELAGAVRRWIRWNT
jgi:hypothetical protein